MALQLNSPVPTNETENHGHGEQNLGYSIVILAMSTGKAEPCPDRASESLQSDFSTKAKEHILSGSKATLMVYLPQFSKSEIWNTKNSTTWDPFFITFLQ